MTSKLITPATAQAVTLAEAKAHLRVDNVDEDVLITSMITTATEACEQEMGGRAIMPQTWEIALDAFPAAFELTRIPASSIVSLKYIDVAGVQQTIGSTLYALDDRNDFGWHYVVPAYQTNWPTPRDEINAVLLRYVAGYANAAAVPESIKSWIKLQVGAMFENRMSEGKMQTHQLGYANRLLDRYKLWYI